MLATADVAIASVSALGIDQTDIRKASLEAMRRATLSLCRRPDFAVIDGRDVPPGLPCPGKAFVKGDSRSVSIAAASVVAKVTRDRMMEAAGLVHPGYGFEKHAGYATVVHTRRAIIELGPCSLHRMSFVRCAKTRRRRSPDCFFGPNPLIQSSSAPARAGESGSR